MIPSLVAGLALAGSALATGPDPTLADDDDVFVLTVVGDRLPAEGPTATTVRLDREDLRAAPRRTAEDWLRQVGGVVLIQHGSEGKGQQYFVRGFDASHGADLEVTVDGIPLNEASHVHAQGYLDLALLIPEAVSGVTFTKGPFTLDQGPFAMAGSARYTLGAPASDTPAELAYTVGTTGRHRGLVQLQRGPSFVAAEATHDDGFGANRSLDRGTLNGRYRWVDAAAGHLDAFGALTGSRFALPGVVRADDVAAGRVAFDGTYDPLGAGAGHRALAALSWQGKTAHPLSATVYASHRNLRLVENFTGALRDPEHGDRFRQEHASHRVGMVATQRWHSPRVRPELGVSARFERFQQREDAVDDDLAVVSTSRHLHGGQAHAHVHAGLTLLPIDAVRLDVGARVDGFGFRVVDRTHNELGIGYPGAVSPRMTAHWQMSPAFTAFAAWGRGLRPPEARAWTEQGENKPPTDITTSTAAELGVRFRPNDRLHGVLAAFTSAVGREALFDHVSASTVSLDPTLRQGVEAQLRLAPRPWLQLGVDATWVYGRFRGTRDPIPNAPPLVAGFRLRAGAPGRTWAALRTLVVGPRPLPFGATSQTLTRTDATAGLTRGRWGLELQLENVLGQALREGEYAFASHWTPREPASALPALHLAAGPPRIARLTASLALGKPATAAR